MRAVKLGAGAILVARGFILLQQRSITEHEPLTWCIYGGMIERGESLLQGCIREVQEEAGLDVEEIRLSPVHTNDYPEQNFRYVSFFGELAEALPVVNSHETNDAGWFQLGTTEETLFARCPAPMHSGMAALLADRGVRARLLHHAQTHAASKENAA